MPSKCENKEAAYLLSLLDLSTTMLICLVLVAAAVQLLMVMLLVRRRDPMLGR